MPAVVVTVTWLRLESPVTHWRAVAAVALLGVAPSVLRPRWASVPVAAVLAVRVAFGEWPRHLGRAASRFGHGFLDFYDVRTPFDPRTHGEMRGVVLIAIFGFVLLVAVAIAIRKLVPAVGGVLLGAGWPATLAGTHASLAVGVAILVASLAVLAGLTARRIPRAVLPAAAALAVAALAASTSSAVAKGGLVHWQRWDFYNAPDAPVSVSFLWNADYTGVDFPKKRTRVLEIEAPPRSLFWRAAVLDRFSGDRWVETAPLRGDALEPKVPASALLQQKVHVLALSESRLVGASVPLTFGVGDAPVDVRAPGFAVLPGGAPQGFTYTVGSYAPRPTPAELQRSRPVYPVELTEPGTFLDVWPSVAAPPFGRPRTTVLDRHTDIERYVPILNAALDVAGDATTPYAATMRVLRWFRQTGGFTYTNHPAIFSEAPLVGFVAETHAGYCQQFAGAMALMLRYLGIPSRVAVGFSSGRYDRKRHRWVVTDHDAHAWVEAWFRGYGWLPFDPTPSGRPELGQLSAPYARLATTTTVFPGATNLPQNTTADSGAASGHHHGEQGTTQQPGFSTTATARSRGHDSLLVALLLLAAAAVGGIALTKLAVRRSRYLTRDPRRLAAACRQELAEYLLDQHIEGARSATLHELGALVQHELAVDPAQFVAAATAARFGPPAGSDAAARQARRELRSLLRRIRRTLNTRDRVRGLLSLRSLGFAA